MNIVKFIIVKKNEKNESVSNQLLNPLQIWFYCKNSYSPPQKKNIQILDFLKLFVLQYDFFSKIYLAKALINNIKNFLFIYFAFFLDLLRPKESKKIELKKQLMLKL